MKILRRLTLLVCAVLLPGCVSVDNQATLEEAYMVAKEPPIELPATYSGLVPCSDCPSAEAVLTLRPDHIYKLRKSFRQSESQVTVEAQMGRWRYSPAERLIILGKRKGSLKTYALEGTDRLQFVEWEGAATEDQVRYDLVRTLAVDPIEDAMKIRGMLKFKGPIAELTECTSGKTFPLEMRGQDEQIRQAYLNTPHTRDQALLASFAGRLLEADSEGAKRKRDVIVLDQLYGFHAHSDCESDQVSTSLTGTIWWLEEVGDLNVVDSLGKRGPFVVFEESRRLGGMGACNRISGSYLIKGDVFLVNQDRTTRIACPEGLRIENLFFRGLKYTEGYRINGRTLELLDQDGQVRMKFIAGP